MSGLAQKNCTPCKGKPAALKGEALAALVAQLPEGWRVAEERRLEKTFKFPDFASALGFVNKAGAVAEQEAHHPDIRLGWGYASFAILTHSIDGLSENDFILAAKIDALYS